MIINILLLIPFFSFCVISEVKGRDGLLTNATQNVDKTEIRLGSIITYKGTTKFIRGVLVTTIDLALEEYFEAQLGDTYDKSLDLLYILEKRGLVMTVAQRDTVDTILRSIAYTFGNALSFLSEKFIRQRWNYSSTRAMELA